MLFGNPQRRPRVALVGARVTQDERHVILVEAERRGMTVTEFVRAALGEYLKVSEMTSHDLSDNET